MHLTRGCLWFWQILPMNRRCVSSFFIHLNSTHQIIWSILLVPSGSSQRKMTVLICPPLPFSFKKNLPCNAVVFTANYKCKNGMSNLLYKLKYRLRPPLKNKEAPLVLYSGLWHVASRCLVKVRGWRVLRATYISVLMALELSHNFRLKCVQCVAWNVGPKTTLTMQLCLQS